MHNRLSRFEDHIQRLVEGGFARLFAGRLHPREVAVQLAKNMEDHALPGEEGLIAPDIYIVRIHSNDHEAILKEAGDLAAQLALELVEMARSGGMSLLNYPEVRLLADDEIPLRQLSISAKHSNAVTSTTEALPLESLQAPDDAPEATLILDEDHHIPVDKPIINLGRHRDNDIILDDMRVSRHHAQIRLRFGQHYLYDLGSSGGTQLNGSSIREAPLSSGDIIRLGNQSVIYVQDDGEPAAPDSGTRPILDSDD